MAFNDIKNWAMLLESEELEREAWDKACEDAASAAAEADRDETDGCEVDQISMEDFGDSFLTTRALDKAETDYDETIDFSSYDLDEPEKEPAKLDEADQRELLTRIAAALERVAGTANLAAQDTVVLNETPAEDDDLFDDMVAEALEGADAEGKTEDDYAEMSAEEFKKILDKMPDGTPDAVKDAVADVYKVAEDYPINDAAPEILSQLSLPEQIDVVKKFMKNPALSKQALDNLKDDLSNMEDELRKTTAENLYMKRALYIQNKSFKEKGVSKDEENEFRELLGKLDDYQKSVLLGMPYRNGYAGHGEQRVFLNPEYLKYNRPGAVKRGDADDDDEPVDKDLAALGIAGGGYTFDPEKVGTYVAEPLEPGYYTFQFDPGRESPTGRLRNAELMRDRLEKEGWIKDYYENNIKPEIAAGVVAQNDGAAEGDVADQDVVQFTKMIRKMPKTEQDKLRDEMKAEAQTDDERAMIDAIFSGKAAYPDFKDLNAIAGIATDQKGGTGAGTQWADKHVNLRLLIMCEFLNIDAEDVALMRKFLRGNTKEARDTRAQIRNRMLKEIVEELQDDAAKLVPVYGVDGRLPRGDVRTEKTQFDKFVNVLLGIVLEHATPEEKEQIRGMYDDFQKNSQVRKWKSFLSNDENREYQKLIAKQRDNGADMTDDEQVRMMQLDLMRRGRPADEARKTAEEILAADDPEAVAKAKGASIDLMKSFLRGGSGTANI